MPWELNSCSDQLASGKIGFVVGCFSSSCSCQGPAEGRSEDLVYVLHSGSNRLRSRPGWVYFITLSCELLIPEALGSRQGLEKTGEEEMNPAYLQVLLLFFPWNFRVAPSSLSVCAFEIANVWVISNPVCLFF